MSETQKAVVKSAKNRAWRTLVQGLSFDVGAAAVLVLYTAISKANGWGDLQWAIIGFTLFKSVAVSMFSYLMRRVFTEQFPPVE